MMSLKQLARDWGFILIQSHLLILGRIMTYQIHGFLGDSTVIFFWVKVPNSLSLTHTHHSQCNETILVNSNFSLGHQGKKVLHTALIN